MLGMTCKPRKILPALGTDSSEARHLRLRPPEVDVASPAASSSPKGHLDHPYLLKSPVSESNVGASDKYIAEYSLAVS